jgi:hypothetical protein
MCNGISENLAASPLSVSHLLVIIAATVNAESASAMFLIREDLKCCVLSICVYLGLG